MDIFIQLVTRIIKEQELIIGPIAWEEAGEVKGLKVSSKKEIKIDGNKKQVLEGLVNQYSRLFGRASEEVCKDAVRDLVSDLPAQEIPAVLR